MVDHRQQNHQHALRTRTYTIHRVKYSAVVFGTNLVPTSQDPPCKTLLSQGLLQLRPSDTLSAPAGSSQLHQNLALPAEGSTPPSHSGQPASGLGFVSTAPPTRRILQPTTQMPPSISYLILIPSCFVSSHLFA
ncbi:hypothetical protein CI102_9531 [Trichoderma harzianum]|nr:hypothetical protein CI102_9531 [Trichoderma harzianum]